MAVKSNESKCVHLKKMKQFQYRSLNKNGRMSNIHWLWRTNDICLKMFRSFDF